jgi:hypothetical protein
MKRKLIARTLTFAATAGAAVLFASCSTVGTRISGHPEIYQSLSPQDQALVSRGQIRPGMSQNAVWLAWGSPDQRVVGDMRGRLAETWVYVTYTYAYPYGYPYGPPGPFVGSFGFVGVSRIHHHFHRTFVFVGDPFFDPFFFPAYFPPSIPVPYKTVTFSNGRVVSFQTLAGPYR